MIRLFIALPIEEDALLSLKVVHDKIRDWGSFFRVISPENYHITMKFLGNCDENLAERITDGFRDLDIGNSKIQFTIKGIGAFPNIKRASVVWCGLKTDRLIVNRIYKKIEDFASGLGFKEEGRDFIPHLTLARIRKGRKLTGEAIDYIGNNRETLFGESSFKRVVLYSSKLTPEGPIYTELVNIGFEG